MSRSVFVALLTALWAPLHATEAEVKPVGCDPKLAIQGWSYSAGGRNFHKLPEGSGAFSHRAVAVTVQRGPLKLVIAIDSQQPGGTSPDVIRFDFSGKGRFSDAPSLPLRVQLKQKGNFWSRFGPATLSATIRGRTLPVCVRGSYTSARRSLGRRLELGMATALAARLAFGERTYHVRVVSGTESFVCGQEARVYRGLGGLLGLGISGDTLVIDTKDGSFARGPHLIRTHYGHPALVDGAWYDVALSPERKKLVARPLAAQMAKIRIAHERWTATLAGRKHIITLHGSTDALAIPADEYMIHDFRQIAPMKQNGGEARIISARLDLTSGATKSFKAPAGETVNVAVGAPLTARLSATVRGRSVTLRLALLDAAGLKALIHVSRAKLPRPQLQILDARGQVVHSHEMNWLWASTRHSYSHKWSVPEGVSGDLTVVGKFPPLPFEVVFEKATFNIRPPAEF